MWMRSFVRDKNKGLSINVPGGLRRCSALTALAVTVLGGAAAAAAARNVTNAPLRLDMPRLAVSEAVMPPQIYDPVWNLIPHRGTRLIEIPLIIDSPHGTVTLKQPLIKLAGARFVCWRIQAIDNPRNRNMQRPRSRSRALPSTTKGNPLLGEKDAVRVANLPAGAPQVTTKLTIHGNGSVNWNLDVAIPGEQVAPGYTNYMLKLRGNRLGDLLPRPTPPPKGSEQQSLQTRRRYAQKQRVEQQRLRNEMRQLIARRRRIQHLPKKFYLRHPVAIWEVFELNQHIPQLKLSGVAAQPWQLNLYRLRVVQEFAAQSRNFSKGKLNLLIYMAQRESVLTQWLVGEAFAASGAAKQIEPGNRIDRLAQTLLKSKSVDARRVVAQSLIGTRQNSAAIEQLLHRAIADKDPLVKFAAFRGLIGGRSHRANEKIIPALMKVADQVLQSPNGPPPAEVLAALLSAAGRNTGRSDHAAQSPLLSVNFAAIPGRRRNEAIVYTIVRAATNRLAGDWLDQKLLGSANADIVHETLVALKKMKLPPEHKSSSRRYRRQPYPSRQLNRSAQARNTLSLTSLAARIPIHNGDHHLLALLASNNRNLRTLAWWDLRDFTIARDAPHGKLNTYAPQSAQGSANGPPRIVIPGRPRQTGRYINRPPRAQGKDPYRVILEHGLKLHPTPGQLVTFFQRQTDSRRGTEAMVQLVLRADPPVSKQAAKALMGTPRGTQRGLAEALRPLSGQDRARFAGQLYAAVKGKASPVVGLLAAKRGDQITRWFSDQVSNGNLPPVKAWAGAFRDRKDLVDMLGSNNKTVVHGAAAALVAAAGGSVQTAASLSQQLDALSPHTPEAAAKKWAQTRSDLYLQTLQGAGGRYRVLLWITSGRDQQSVRKIILGTVTLVVDSSGVKLASQTIDLAVGNQPHAIAVPNLTDLKNFDSKSLQDVLLSQPRQPLELIRQPNGSWAGRVQLMSGKTLTMTMTAVSNG